MQGLRKCWAYEANRGYMRSHQLEEVICPAAEEFEINLPEGKARMTSWFRGANSSYGAIVQESL